MSESDIKSRQCTHTLHVIGYLNLSRISKTFKGYISSKHYRFVHKIMAMINLFSTVSLFLASDTEHGTKTVRERDSRSKNIITT